MPSARTCLHGTPLPHKSHEPQRSQSSLPKHHRDRDRHPELRQLALLRLPDSHWMNRKSSSSDWVGDRRQHVSAHGYIIAGFATFELILNVLFGIQGEMWLSCQVSYVEYRVRISRGFFTFLYSKLSCYSQKYSVIYKESPLGKKLCGSHVFCWLSIENRLRLQFPETFMDHKSLESTLYVL